MAEVFDSLGIWGLPKKQEIMMLQSLITGDPLLMVGRHGGAKTKAAKDIAKALRLNFQSYDASKSMFEDMLGLPSPKAMQEGRMEYISSPITCWDKEFIFIDEVNRALPELQSKWLEIIRSREVMGFKLNTKFIWGAMNPMGYEGTNMMDEAYIGRFASFIDFPSVLEMNNDDRIEIIDSVGMDDAPALGFWLNDKKEPKDDTEQEKDLQVHRKIIALLTLATENYILMSKQMEFNKISSFLSRFAKSIEARTSSTDTEKKREKIELDGRRLGYIRRCIIGYRAMEIAHSNLYMSELSSFEDSVKEAILGSIPVGINAENAIDDFAETQLKNVFDQLKDFFLEDKDLVKVNLNYELMVSPDPIRKAEILINEDIGKIAKNSAWTRIMEETSIDISILCMLALNIESVNRGTIPPNILDQMTTKIDNKTIKIQKPILMGESIKYYDRVTDLITQGANKIEQIIICNEVNKGIKNSKNEMFFTDDDFKVIVDSCNKSLEKIRKICRYKGSLEA
ncbi:MAG TPA: hypothetical protein EYQ08_05785 [Planctomycetes bacterium]|nr:hypothetical protein [Planctomycetota bacterium]